MKDKELYIATKDYSVSGEEFQLFVNPEFGFLETYPHPDLFKLPEYYKSEDYISHTDYKRNLFEKAYHFVRTISLKNKLKLIDSVSESTNKNLLDVGCGTGDFLSIAKKNKWTVTGVEPNNNARVIANQKTNNSIFDVDYLHKFEKHSFDVITLWHVLEHLPNLQNQILNLKSLLKQNGRLIIAVPNFNSFDAKYYKNFWAAYDTPRHFWHFNKESILKLFASFNMEIESIHPMTFDAFYVSLLSEKYKRNRMNYIRAFYIGLWSNFKAQRTGEYSSLIYVIKNP